MGFAGRLRSIGANYLRTQKAQTPRYTGYEGVWGAGKSLTMTYFHTGIRTIIGAKSFHCPVRDGKEWYQLAMVVRHKGLPLQHEGAAATNS